MGGDVPVVRNQDVLPQTSFATAASKEIPLPADGVNGSWVPKDVTRPSGGFGAFVQDDRPGVVENDILVDHDLLNPILGGDVIHHVQHGILEN